MKFIVVKIFPVLAVFLLCQCFSSKKKVDIPQAKGCIKGDCVSQNGVYVYDNGDVYTGSWKDSLRDGQGGFVYANGDSFEGLWQKDLKEGKGLYVFQNGEAWKGNFSKGIQKGQGEYKLRSGAIFQGEFQSDGNATKGILNKKGKEMDCELKNWKLFCS